MESSRVCVAYSARSLQGQHPSLRLHQLVSELLVPTALTLKLLRQAVHNLAGSRAVSRPPVSLHCRVDTSMWELN